MLIDAPSAAKPLALSTRTLWSLTRCGAIPCVRIGRRVLYRPCELEAWVAAGAPDSPGSGDRIRESMREGGR
ncbi:MAG: helix-turn-helix domain-containing protein [Planctomycetota bacterium]